jgi:Cysteine-rich secretory protein family
MSLVRRASASVATLVTVLVAVLCGFALVSPAAHASTSSSLFSLTNASRASAGLAPYAYSSELSAVALARAESMVAHNQLTHAGLASSVGNWAYLGENVGYGASASVLEAAFMASPEHRANILDHDFTQVGVGSVTVGATVWVSVIFRKPLHGTSSKAPSKAPSTRTKPSARTQVAGTSAGAGKPTRRPVAKAPAALLARGAGCAVSPVAVQQILGLASVDHSVRLVEQSQRLVSGYQCGKGLPVTGLLDDSTLRSLAS